MTGKRLRDLGMVEAIVLGLAFVVVVVGGIVVILGNLAFGEYLRQLTVLAAAFGLLGIGRSLRMNGK